MTYPASFKYSGFALLIVFTFMACDTGSALDEEDLNDGDLPAVFQQFSADVEVYRDGDFVVLESTGVPNHSSPYFATSDSRYATYDGDNAAFQLNPNRIDEQRFTFRIPLVPAEAATHAATPLGAIGVAVNGVAIFNQYAGPNQPLTFEIDSFDQYNGHPQQTGVYHYHIEPFYLTATEGKEALVGFLLDGFPVYGPVEEGQTVTNADLDELHGHIGPTADYPDGIYHYHITDQDPYINGAGFYWDGGDGVAMIRMKTRLLPLLLLLLTPACTDLPTLQPSALEEPVVQVFGTDPGLHKARGLLFQGDHLFTGLRIEQYEDGTVKRVTSYVNGRAHGPENGSYPGGASMYERFYKHGKKTGTHRGWWENGVLKFEYHFRDDLHEGSAKEWFKDGTPYRVFSYENGKESGGQQMWYEDGTLRANYVVKEGRRYGLIGAKPCSNPSSERTSS